MIPRLTSRLRRFSGESEGSVTVEAMLVLPVLLWLFGAVWVWFDVSRQQSLNQKVNYTIGDMYSRETDAVDAAYMDNAYRLSQTMLAQTAADTDLRISVVTFKSGGNGANPSYELVWSHSRGSRPAMTELSADQIAHIPIMARGDELIITELWSDYMPAFEAGLPNFDIATYSFTRPRFAPQVLYEGSKSNSTHDNGWGNGDTDAPGNSLCNNNAENYDEALEAVECLVDETIYGLVDG